jgi:hypothetical protein
MSYTWVVLLVGLFISYTLRSTGTYQDDDIAHFLIARWSWHHPHLLLDTWGRPAFTILYAPVAPLGLFAVRIYSALLAGIVCGGAALLARLYGLRWYYLAVPLTGLQPEFVRQAFSSLTELTFALILCLTLIAYRQRYWTLYASDIDGYDPAIFRPITPSAIESAPPGTLIVWDGHYSHRLSWNTPLNMLQHNPQYQLLQSFRADNFVLFFYLKKDTATCLRTTPPHA